MPKYQPKYPQIKYQEIAGLKKLTITFVDGSEIKREGPQATDLLMKILETTGKTLRQKGVTWTGRFPLPPAFSSVELIDRDFPRRETH